MHCIIKIIEIVVKYFYINIFQLNIKILYLVRTLKLFMRIFKLLFSIISYLWNLQTISF